MALSGDAISDTVNRLIRMSDSYTSIPSKGMYDILKKSIENASNGVAGTFYDNVQYRTHFGGTEVTEELGRIASIVMCNTMRHVSIIFICYEYENE